MIQFYFASPEQKLQVIALQTNNEVQRSYWLYDSYEAFCYNLPMLMVKLHAMAE